ACSRSKQPFVSTTPRPAARHAARSRTSSASVVAPAAARGSRMSSGYRLASVALAELELAARRGRVERRPPAEGPPVERAVDPHVLDAALDAERVLAAQVVVGGAVAPVRRQVDEVRAFDEAQVLERDAHLGLAFEAARDVVLEVGVGAVDAGAVGGEE